jgi:hypothetical protein
MRSGSRAREVLGVRSVPDDGDGGSDRAHSTAGRIIRPTTPLVVRAHKQGIEAAKAHELVDELVVLGGDEDVLDAYAQPVEEKRGLAQPGARPPRLATRVGGSRLTGTSSDTLTASQPARSQRSLTSRCGSMSMSAATRRWEISARLEFG